MKRTLYLLTFFALVVVWAAPALTQVTGTRFSIPFNFQVGKQALPGGEYRLSSVGEQALLISRIDGQAAIVAMTLAPVENPLGNRKPKLVFNRYGNKHFLSEAWLNSSARALPKAEEEAQYARNLKGEKEFVYAKGR